MFGIVIVSHVIISIHAPREGCDQTAGAGKLTTEFQSTHPVRGATHAAA